MELPGHTVQAQQSGNLRPVAHFMHQHMNNDFLGSYSQHGIHQLELERNIPFLDRKSFNKVLKVSPAFVTKLKKRFEIIRWHGARIGQWSAHEPLDITLCGGKNVPREFANSSKAAVPKRSNAGLQN